MTRRIQACQPWRRYVAPVVTEPSPAPPWFDVLLRCRELLRGGADAEAVRAIERRVQARREVSQKDLAAIERLEGRSE